MHNKPVYILSLEASDVYSHMHRGTALNYDYCGMIPFSLELIKLRQEGLKVKKIKHRDKEITNDVINLKFKQKVKSGIELKKVITNKIDESKGNEEYIAKLESFLDTIDEGWSSVNVNELRNILYTEGFTIRHKDRELDTVKLSEYVVYKRSSSKSRTGQCLFIKKSLYRKMIKWSRMSLPLKKDMEIDLAGLLAYESLVGSSLENTIEIDPERILMIDDVESKFNQIANVVRKGKNEFLDSFKEDVKIKNSLFDGQSLLDERYFTDGSAMKLLRNHMFKSAAFNTNIQKYLKDNCPENIQYDNWQLKDMFGNTIYAKDVDLICTPSSLKALKFSSIIGNDNDMWEYWKQKVHEDGDLFGVCKHDKPSKHGEDENGNVLQQASYQMINCLPLSENDIKELTTTEKKYIERLKNDDDFFIDKVKNSATMINSNEMLSALFELNKKVINTEMFRKFRKDFLWTHVNHVKKGKIKLKGDYCVMIGNPMEFLRHSLGKFDITTYTPSSLKGDEVYTKLFEFDKEYVGFRNPNTSPSNVLIVKNKYVEEIDKYFNFTENIVCVNAINFPLQDILSGSDYDSDTVLLFNDEKMLEVGKSCFGNYHVCVNDVESQKKKYKLNKHDMCEIDNQLSTSQRNIGKVVNLGQFCMSVYWDLLNNGHSGEHVDELLKKVDVMTVLSGIAIDMAKKFYEIDIEKEIGNVASNEELKKRKRKPLFWKYVSQSKSIDKRIERYDCPMDYLIENIDDLNQADRKKDIPFQKFLIKKNEKKANRKQIRKVDGLIKDADNLIKSEIVNFKDKNEKFRMIDDILKDYSDKVKKLKIKDDTMYEILKGLSDSDSQIMLRMLKTLYETQQEVFLKSFKRGKK